MAHYSTLSGYRFADAAEADDVRGSKLYGRDGEKLGTIEDVVFDHERGDVRYAVVDTGGWLNSRKFLVPAQRVQPRIEKGKLREDEFSVNLSKAEIENLPVYDDAHLQDEKRWRNFEAEYRVSTRALGWTEEGDVLHQEGTTRILTPETSQIPANAPHIAPGDHAEGLHPNRLEHRSVGMMNTSPTAQGQRPENDRLVITTSDAPRPAGGGGIGADINTSVAEDLDQLRSRSGGENLDMARKRETSPDLPPGTAGMASGVVTRKAQHGREMEENVPIVADISSCTIEGDAIFNSEDVRHQRGQAVEDRDVPAYDRPRPVTGDTGMDARWSRFGTHVRKHLEEIRGTCSVCEGMGNRHKKDDAA